MNEPVDIQVYVSAVTESSRRTGTAMYLLLVATVVMFAAYWNVRPGGWTTARIEKAENALQWFGWKDSVRAKLDPEQQVAFDESRHFAEMFHLESKEQLKEQIKFHTDRYWQQSVIEIPIFNIQLDVADLGMLGGFTFVNILILLRLSLGRELANLKFAFGEANRRGQLWSFYHLLSLHQVLSVPPHQSAMIGRVWSKANRALLVLPFFIQALIFKNDWKTRAWGMAMSATNTITLLSFGFICLILIGLLTIVCFRAWEDYDAEWKRQADCLEQMAAEAEGDAPRG